MDDISEVVKAMGHFGSSLGQGLVLGDGRLTVGVGARSCVAELHFWVEHSSARADAPGDQRLRYGPVAQGTANLVFFDTCINQLQFVYLIWLTYQMKSKSINCKISDPWQMIS